MKIIESEYESYHLNDKYHRIGLEAITSGNIKWWRFNGLVHRMNGTICYINQKGNTNYLYHKVIKIRIDSLVI